jgi:hypothetical protein
MSSTQNYFTNVMACLSQEMDEKFEYATEAFIKEIRLKKDQEEEAGNKETYKWLNIIDSRGRVQHIQGIILSMFNMDDSELLTTVISDYFVPEDIIMIKKFTDAYCMLVYKDTQAFQWRIGEIGLGLYIYMNIHSNFVKKQLYHKYTTPTTQLK